MENSGFRSHDPPHLPMCSVSDSAHNIFNLKFSELSSSKYNYFLYGFKDEEDFEEFKQDLRDFQRLKHECAGEGWINNDDDLNDLKEELQFICRPNDVCKNRRKSHTGRSVKDVASASFTLQSTSPTALSPQRLSSQDEVACLEAPRSSPRIKHRPLSKGRPDSFGLRADFERRSGLFGFDRRSGLRSSINDIIMEFLNGDEHFQEFERVYATINNHRVSKDMDISRPLSTYLDDQANVSTPIKGSQDFSTEKANQPSSSRYVGEIFADFFDNDETFLEFEKEFEKFRSCRKSNLLENLSNMGSSRDIFGDLKSYCDRSMKSNSSSLLSVNSCWSQDEATPSCGDESASHDLIWRSVEDWEMILRKMRRNSKFLLDMSRPQHHYQHRHSLQGPSQSPNKSGPHRAQSLADLSRCHENDDGNNSMLYNTLPITPTHKLEYISHSPSRDAISASSSFSQRKQQPESNPLLQDSVTNSDIQLASDDGSSSGKWSETFGDDNRYSSTSTLCSGNDDLSCSFSCSCSDLYIEEDTDDDVLAEYSRSPTSRTRSHSLMELPNRRPTGLGMHTSSADNLLNYQRSHKNHDVACNVPAHVSLLLARDEDMSTDDDTSVTSEGPWSRPTSTISAQLSDVDSEHYHTATSDLSDHYSTAKSEISTTSATGSRFESHRSPSLDLSDVGSPDADSYERSFDWAPQHFDKDDFDYVRSGQYNSYHGREGRSRCRQERPRSGSACHYTCHQHCVPFVTLNCKSVSEDGCDVVAATTPSPSDPRSNLETSLSMGNMCIRPGCARIVSGHSNAATSSTASGHAPRLSESLQNFQPLGQQTNIATNSPSLRHPGASQVGSHGYVQVANSPAHHLSRSASEGYVTTQSLHASSQQAGDASSPSRLLKSQGHHISTPAQSGAHPPTSLPTGTSHLSPCPGEVTDHLSCVNHPGAQGTYSSNNINSDSNFDNNRALPNTVENSLHSSETHGPEGESQADLATEKDETDSGYRSGTIPDDKLPRVPSQATLDRQELKRKIAKFNHFVPAASLEATGKESFQGFLKVTMNLIRPITMELGARPPSIYELLTREHIIEENTQQVAFYMPRDTHKSLHITSDTTTKEVVTTLLKKFHILDHPRKFAMYEQEFNDRNKLVRLRRLADKDYPIRAILTWDPERIRNYRVVLQENETGEIVWDAFSLPELSNFLKVLDREEKETILELKHKYAYMKQYMERRVNELRNERNKKAKT